MSDMYNQRTTSRPVNACFSVRSILMSSCVRWDPLLAHANRRGKATRFWSVESFLPDWAGIVKDRQSDLVPSEVVPRIRRLVFRNRSEPKSTEGTRPPRGTRPVPSVLVPRIRRLALGCAKYYGVGASFQSIMPSNARREKGRGREGTDED